MPLLPSIPPSVYTAFIVSFAVTVLLVLTQRWHGRFSMDGVQGIQKQHKNPTPRIGGVAIVCGVLAAWLVARPERRQFLGPLLVAGLPAFVFGLLEDLTKKVSVMARLLATMASGVVGWLLTGMSITSLDVAGVDMLMGITIVSVAFTAFAVGGVANAINIIDGFNGLASGFVVLALMGLAAMAMGHHDVNLALACLCIAGAMLGFWLVNWPWGKIFLGDGGSYFGGFALAWACVMLVERNPSITPFAPLLVCTQGQKRVVATIGVSNAVIVHTPDALLVADKSRSQDVKKVVDALKQRRIDSAQYQSTVLPASVSRPWGTYTTLKEEGGYKVKRITVRPGQSLSLQYHHHRSEHWTFVRGQGVVQIGDQQYSAGPGKYHYIPLKELHRLTNTGKEELVLIEVQIGDYLGEDDIVRLKDNYGRA